jgi:hypothetical protein
MNVRWVSRIRLTFGTLASRDWNPQKLGLDEGIIRSTEHASGEIPRVRHLSRFGHSGRLLRAFGIDTVKSLRPALIMRN